MKFYIENHTGERVFDGTRWECEAEMNRLIYNEFGYWRMFDESDPNEPWQTGGVEELEDPANKASTPTAGTRRQNSKSKSKASSVKQAGSPSGG